MLTGTASLAPPRPEERTVTSLSPAPPRAQRLDQILLPSSPATSATSLVTSIAPERSHNSDTAGKLQSVES